MTRARIVLLGILAVVASVFAYQEVEENLQRRASLEQGT